MLQSLPSWERGLKFLLPLCMLRLEPVAPLVGAWIEISRFVFAPYSLMSLPSWERGLKFFVPVETFRARLSLPSWERGLK